MSRLVHHLKTPTAGLIALAALPVLFGSLQLALLAVGLWRGAPVMEDLGHYVLHPVPIALHLVTGIGMLGLGLVQLSPRLRLTSPLTHRISGRLFVLCGVVCGLTALWMNQTFPAFGSWSKYGSNLLFGVLMPVFVILGMRAAILRDIARHRAWMIRAYAVALGAGTQRLLILPILAVRDLPGDPWLGLLLGLSWAINLGFAEWWLRRRAPRHRAAGTPAARPGRAVTTASA